MARENVGTPPLRGDDAVTVEWVEDQISTAITQLSSVQGLIPVAEIPTGTRDGANNIFTTQYAFVAGSTNVFRNGLLEYLGMGYNEVLPDQLVFTSPPIFDDDLIVKYVRS